MFFLSINISGVLQPLFECSSVTIFIQGLQRIGYIPRFPLWLTTILTQGGNGIKTVLPIIPEIGIMYVSLSFLEDSGYMARAAFVVDLMMQVLGLPGKSFVPLIIGFSCNVSAVMATRTLDTLRERLTTVLMAPFMSCRARLTIFVIFSSEFFNQQESLAVFSLYMIGIITAIFIGLMIKYTIMTGEVSPFIMELPVYHLPNLNHLILHTWPRLKSFVLRSGTIIIIVSTVIGTLNSFSFRGKTVNATNDSALASVSKFITPLLYPIDINRDN